MHLGSRPIGAKPARPQARTNPVDHPSESKRHRGRTGKICSNDYKESPAPDVLAEIEVGLQQHRISTVHTLYLAAGGRKGSG